MPAGQKDDYEKCRTKNRILGNSSIGIPSQKFSFGTNKSCYKEKFLFVAYLLDLSQIIVHFCFIFVVIVFYFCFHVTVIFTVKLQCVPCFVKKKFK